MIFIYAGILYLIGIAFLLMWKPGMMFTAEGDWKEFGLGRSSDRYTWMPFWLFSILWAIVSYTLVLVGVGYPTTSTVSEMNQMGYYVRTRGNQYVFIGKRSPRIVYYDGMQGEDLADA